MRFTECLQAAEDYPEYDDVKHDINPPQSVVDTLRHCDRFQHIRGMMMLAAFARTWKLTQWILFLGFEQEAFQPYELAPLYWWIFTSTGPLLELHERPVKFVRKTVSDQEARTGSGEALAKTRERDLTRIYQEHVVQAFALALNVVSLALIFSP